VANGRTTAVRWCRNWRNMGPLRGSVARETPMAKKLAHAGVNAPPAA
jgi:hypothetical protein